MIGGAQLIERLQARVRADALDQLAHYELGREYLKEGRYLEAAAESRRAVEINPEYIAAWRTLGEAYRLVGVAKEARAAWETGLNVSRRDGQQTAAADFEALLAGLPPEK